jgi:16S rRNA A1518/A1519 N6-dimethyltransferase RsmA/KsgA/DIM1 with predicted DNA glycosylase/AP lyase activity
MLAGRKRGSIMVCKSIKYGQNFLISRRLVAYLIKAANIIKNDVVYEIGTGSGIITHELSKCCKKVLSIEIDRSLFSKAFRMLKGVRNVELIHGDFLSFSLPKFEYKVFASLPFNITSRVMHKLFIHGYAPTEAYFIMERGAALRFTGAPTMSLNSMTILARFQISIVANLKKSDFHPAPKVNIVFLKVIKRLQPGICRAEWKTYEMFLHSVFSIKRKYARYNLKGRIKYPEWKRLAKLLDFELNVKPSGLSYNQILGLFRYLQNRKDNR